MSYETVHNLLFSPRMNIAALLLALVVGATSVNAQDLDPAEGTTVASAQVSGFDLRRLSPGLQDEIARLAGGPLSREQLRSLATRIEAEQPRYVAAVRVVRAPDDEVRVVFVVAHMRDQDREPNINARYLVDRVDIKGYAESDLPQAIRDDLRALVGSPAGAAAVDAAEEKLRAALPNYTVQRRINRGDRAGEVRLVFVIEPNEAARWLRFEPLNSNILYHSDQGWGAFLDLPFSGRDFRITPIIAIDNGDDLIEEYSGFGLRFESRKLGTERLGASVEWTTFDQSWRDATLAALELAPLIPQAYDDRSTITPLLSFALTRQVRVSGGVSVTELEPLSGLPDSQMANAIIASIGFSQRWEHSGGGGDDHDLSAGFIVRAARRSLESDFDYTRYSSEVEYKYGRSRHTVLLSGRFGVIDGSAPLFDRFSLGDSQTLRGWNKYDIAPAGGDRVFHTSAEYRYRGWGFFLDSGSVWDKGSDARVRVATGMGFNGGPFFATVGFPLNTDDVRAVFTTGVRFGGVGVRKY